jgi:hypothetical protein
MIITGLNASLRTDVVLYMYREMLEKVRDPPKTKIKTKKERKRDFNHAKGN